MSYLFKNITFLTQLLMLFNELSSKILEICKRDTPSIMHYFNFRYFDHDALTFRYRTKIELSVGPNLPTLRPVFNWSPRDKWNAFNNSGIFIMASKNQIIAIISQNCYFSDCRNLSLEKKQWRHDTFYFFT